MYTGNDPFLIDLQTQITNLSVRLTSLDGYGTSVPANASVPQLYLLINGLQTQIKQVTLQLEAELNALTTAVNNLTTLVNTRLTT